MKSHPLIQMILLYVVISLTACTYTTKLGDKFLPDAEYNTLVVKADSFMHNGEWAKAADLYEKAGQIKPEDWALKLKQAQAYQYEGKLAQAFNTYQIIIDAKLLSNEANNKIVKAAKDNQAKFGFKNEPDVSKVEEVKEASPQETPQADEALQEEIMEEIPPIPEQSLTMEEVTQTPEEAESFVVDTDKAILEAVNAWADAWASKNLTAYFAHYADSFAGDLPNATAWRQSRKTKILRSPRIKVTLSEIQVTNHETTVEVVFKQNYESGAYQDIGRKTLQLQLVKGNWRIIKETFK